MAVLIGMLFAFLGGVAIGFILGIARGAEETRKRAAMFASVQKAYDAEFNGGKKPDA